MTIKIVRNGPNVIAYDDNDVALRHVECSSVQNAVVLETKLNSDPWFTRNWARDGDPKAIETKPHASERPFRASR